MSIPDFLNRLNPSFVFAKTLAATPHWYVKRTAENETDYVALWHAIHDHGRYEVWRGRRYKYWHAGDGFKYWYMGALFDRAGAPWSKIINRCKVEQA